MAGTHSSTDINCGAPHHQGRTAEIYPYGDGQVGEVERL
jgi:hypothetical protein